MNAYRAALLAFFSTLILTGLVNAQSTDPRPSRKASVVMPLLNQLSPKDSPKTVLEQIDRILGRSDSEEVVATRGAPLKNDRYKLDDGTGIIVLLAKDNLVSVAHSTAPPEWKILKFLYCVKNPGTGAN